MQLQKKKDPCFCTLLLGGFFAFEMCNGGNEEECVTNVAYPHARLYETFFSCLLSKRVLCTYEDGPPLALLLHPAVLLPR